MKMMKNAEALKKLNAYTEQLIQKEIDGYSKEYKESKWYKKPTLKEVVGVPILADIEAFQKALESGICDISHYVQTFEQAASEYGSSWWDDDLGCERCGCEEETEIYIDLRNLAAETIGLKPVDWSDYYKGRGV